MLFNSFEFAIFLPVSFLLYWFIFQKNLKAQNIFLLLISYLFYGWWDWRFLSLIIFSSLIDYFAGIKIEASKTILQKKIFLWLSLCTNLGFLGFFKYYNFFQQSFTDMMSAIGLQTNSYSIAIILPVGISFYTFQTMSYSIDVYRGEMKPTKNIIAFLAYVSFFPQLVAGPIERAINLLPQFKVRRFFNFEDGAEGLRLILWGLFKKVVIADNCAVFVNQIFNNYQDASGLELILGAVLFAFQIYGDFSGYSDIAIGVAKLFGFNLMTNFRTPYFSRDIAEFWRRWHISLSTWFRDYLYIPLGGSRGPKNRIVLNTFIIFIVSGFWHGANWTFIVWGLLNAVYFLPLLLLRWNRNNMDVVAKGKLFPSFKEIGQIGLTFALTCLAWIFFRSESVGDAFNYIQSISFEYFIPSNFSHLKSFLPPMILIWLVFEWLSREAGLNIFLKGINVSLLRYSIYYLLIFCIWAYGAFEEVQFIYFQF